MTWSTLLNLLERALLSLGVLGLSIAGVIYLDAIIGSNCAVAAFESSTALAVKAPPREPDSTFETLEPDPSLWSELRKQILAEAGPETAPLALLEINRLGLRVPVFHGTDRITLNRGAGIVDGTALPGKTGNKVVSAHRDSYFRALKDIELGDIIELHTFEGETRFEVTELFVTDPFDMSVLAPTDGDVLTLITCYPFYYVGYAPDRFIVRARPVILNPSVGKPL